MFVNREEAGRVLAERLIAYRDDPNALILALPRGGVAVGYAVSLALHVPMDVFLTRKLRAPGDPEYAIGAVTETGSVYLNPHARQVSDSLSASPDYLGNEIRAQKEEIARREILYRHGRPLPVLADRTIVLVDDGIATGATFIATIQDLRSRHVRRLVAGIPVGPLDTLRGIKPMVDELLVLMVPEPFFAVGNQYMDFRRVKDDDVVRYLVSADTAIRDAPRPSHA